MFIKDRKHGRLARAWGDRPNRGRRAPGQSLDESRNRDPALVGSDIAPGGRATQSGVGRSWDLLGSAPSGWYGDESLG